MLRLIQSIPSLKAEPFKRWLAKTGYERLEDIENPELAQKRFREIYQAKGYSDEWIEKRIREIYQAKGYSDEWIEKRIRGINVCDKLTNEWKKRGVKEQLGFDILTTEISMATFSLSPSEYKKFKDLDKPNDSLRDHMNDLELIFTMLGKASTTEIAKN